MSARRERNRRSFQLESLEGRLAPSGGMHAMHDVRDVDPGPTEVDTDENHRGRDTVQDRGRNDAVDNDANDGNDNDANDVNDPNDNNNVQNQSGRGPGGPAQNSGDHGGRGPH